jgi:RNA polymerase sigma factor (sigma-70 family)
VRSRRGAEGLAEALEASELAPHRRAVIAHLRVHFGGSLSEEDFEDLAQEALLEVHRRARQGETIRDARAFMKLIAWRDARDLVVKQRPRAADPHGSLLQGVSDEKADPEARLIRRAELASAIEAAERLPREEQAVYRLHFIQGVKPREACKALGIPRSTYYLRLAQAVDLVEATLAPERYAEVQRELLSRFVSGTASLGERIRARRLIKADPLAAAVARELRRVHDSAAATIPAAVIGGKSDGWTLGRVGHAVAELRGRMAGARADTGSEQAAAQLSTGSARGAGAGGAGLLAKLAGGGTASKLFLTCLAGGAAATTCAVTGVVPGVHLAGGRADTPPARHAAPPEIRPLPASIGTAPSQPQAAPWGSDGQAEPPVAGPPPEPAPSPEPTTTTTPIAASAPPTQQEFGVPAAATSSSGSGGGGGAAAARREFGP